MNRIIGTYETNGKMIEYSIVGDGEPVLVMHGGHSNRYEEFGYQNLVDHGYRVITPSRSGYGETSIVAFDAACDLYMALLDHLHISVAHLIGFSAGGPSAIKLAVRFPARFQTLTLQSAVTGQWLTPDVQEYKTAQLIFRPGAAEAITWHTMATFSNLFPRASFYPMFSSLSTLLYRDAKHLIKKEDIEEIRKMNNRQRSGSGFLMDMETASCIKQSDLANIQHPTLIQKSRNDRSVSKKHAYVAKMFIPGAILKFYDTWGHLIWLGKGAEQVDQDIVAFLRKNKKKEDAF